MKRLLLLLVAAGLLAAACVAPQAAQPPTQVPDQANPPEVIVFRSPT